ncbi:MAG: ABC transporter permease [Atopobiaceae bacterium]|nr:ABC transporter permease [Atopobiaceae bacterium]MCH4180761.1 ABC transporter permease [Atopobiaceae bacterium]MCH4214474.1 ABC transporter permease [Atopobiaceae bacterium]MCH4229404.1 ABC transporter permease [Atopobiaceae bacterium]MCH4276638.1 ABC transporter permease [Atopobiaceae bacterium]
MAKYIIRRILQSILVLFGVSIVVFLIMRVFSADPAPVVLGEHATADAMQAWRDANGLNDPIVVQYLNFIGGALHGDLGTSYYTHTSVTTEIMSRFPATIELALVAIVIATILGLVLGVVSAVHKGTAIDGISMVIALVGVSMPIFWLGILLIILFAGQLHLLPSGGRIDPLLQPVGGTGFYLIDTLLSGDFEALGNALQHIILPALALSMYSMAIITRMTRSSMLDTLNEDYVRTARAKGLRKGVVTRHHALRNAMLPITTVIGLQLGSLLGGAVLTETVFAWPGIGKYTVECILKSDFPVVQGVVLLIGCIFVIINLVVDIIYAYLDPRIKYSKEEG